MRTLPCLLLLTALATGGCTPAAKGPTETATTGGSGSKTLKDLAVEIDGDALPRFTVDRGKSAKHKIKVLRQEYKGDLALEFDVPKDAGLKLEAAAIPAGKDETEITITAQPDAKGGRVSIRASAPDHNPKVLVEQEILPQ